jgi:hypothetical protein
VIVIVARDNDPVARSLVSHWTKYGAALLTPTDLSLAGWSHAPGAIGEDTIVVSKRQIPCGAITGILTRLPCVCEQDVAHIVAEDRAYVASEMTAFLLSWLAGLDCPLLNRPTPTCLSGPGWRAERWVDLAGQLGIPVCLVSRHAKWSHEPALRYERQSRQTVTVIADRCLETVDERLLNHARRLAKAAKVDLLRVRFSEIDREPRFLDADPWPDISSDQAADAVHEYLCKRPLRQVI